MGKPWIYARSNASAVWFGSCQCADYYVAGERESAACIYHGDDRSDTAGIFYGNDHGIPVPCQILGLQSSEI